jgi:hypothetical protein
MPNQPAPKPCIDCGASCTRAGRRCKACNDAHREHPRLQLTDEPWIRYARCYVEQIDPDVFFPGQGQSLTPAKRICATCPATKACLNYALRNGERFGVWGGKSEKERKAIRRRIRLGVAA